MMMTEIAFFARASFFPIPSMHTYVRGRLEEAKSKGREEKDHTRIRLSDWSNLNAQDGGICFCGSLYNV